MSELDQRSGIAASPRIRIAPHRQLLSNLDRVDSASDTDATSDDEPDSTQGSHDDGEAGRLLGVSISRAQTHMKSPRTSAFAKAQAIEDSRHHLELEPSPDDGDDVPPILNEIHMTQSPDQDTESVPPSPCTSRPVKGRRSSLTRAILDGAHDNNKNRKRSSSGPRVVLENFRKIFTDLPSNPGFGSDSQRDNNNNLDSNKATHDVNASNTGHRNNGSQSIIRSSLAAAQKITRGSITSFSEPDMSRRKTVQRRASDNSLYLMRTTTGASEFDNTNAFTEVAEMANARFKAITDSLADASIKIPKMPSIITNRLSRTNSDATRSNNTLDRSLDQSLGLTDSSDSHSQHIPHHPPLPSGDKKHPILTDAFSQMTGDIVFLGGYRGSILRSAEPPHHQLWVPVKVGLNLRKVDLEVGLSHEDEEKMEETIFPSGMLSHIGPIDIGRRLIKRASKCPNARANQLRVHDWGYDWRLSPHFLSQKLIKFLESLQCNHPDTAPESRGALVVAHSLGGLITRHAVNQRPELFSGVVYAGAPQNCCNILGPLRNGDDVLLSSRVLTAQVNFTLRTSYALLPQDGRCFLDKETGERYDIDFFDINNWDEYRFSPCINAPLPPFVQTKKGLVDSITDSISSLSPTKKLSWFSSSPNITPPEPSPKETIKDRARSAREDIGASARAAGENIKQDAQDSLAPSMEGASTTQNKPTVATTSTIPKAEAREYLARTLAEVKQFKIELDYNPAHQDANRYPPHAIIYSKNVPTVFGAKVACREAIKCSDAFEDLAFAAGDGVVLASAAQLPRGYRCVRGGRIESDRGHIGLLGDLEGIGKCLVAVVEGRKKGIGLGKGK